MSINVLLSGGRAPVSLELARAFASRGHNVFVAESLPYFLTRSSRAVRKSFLVPPPAQQTNAFIQKLGQIIKDNKISVYVPTCEEIFYVSQFKDQIPCLVWVDQYEKLQLLHSKFAFMKELERLNLNPPKTEFVATLEECRSRLAQVDQSIKWVLKPVFSRFAAKTVIDFAPALKKLELPISQSNPYVLQQFINGPEICTLSVAYKGKVLAHVNYAHEFTAGKGAGICFESVRNPAVEAWVATLVKELNFTGQLAFDFILSPSGNFVLECNPRSTSGIHLLSAEQLEAVFLNPESINQTQFPKVGSAGRIGLAMWLYGLPSVQNLSRLRHWLKLMVSAREVIFSWRDPMPFFEQFKSYFEFYKRSKANGISLLEASTLDIEWNGSIKN